MSGVSRRRVLQGGLYAACLPLRFSAAHAAELPLIMQQVAPGLHFRRGLDQDASAQNDDAIANIGFIVGRQSVAVFDPGGSLADGRRLRAAIRQVTALPIRYVLMSHGHPDHIFGAGAFEQDKPQFVGHERLPNSLAQRGDYYSRRLEAVLGKGSAGPAIPPTRLVRERQQEQIDLGDRVLSVTAHGIAHSDCDLSVLDLQSGTLLAGDLLFIERIPSLDGRLTGWLAELKALKAVPALRAVPGHGPLGVNWPAATADLERYLGVLLRETQAAIKRGQEIDSAAETVGQSERGKWKLFDDYHGHNVIQAFKELEWK